MESQSPAAPRKINIFGLVLDLSSVGLIYLVAQIAVGFVLIVSSASDLTEIGKKPIFVLLAYINGGIATLGLTYGLMRLRGFNLSILKLRKFRAGDIGYAIIGYLAYMIVAVIVGSLLRQIPGVDLDQKQELGFDTITGMLVPLAFIALVVVPPLAEEVLFRGFLYGRLKHHKLSPITAALVTSLLFGLVHGQLNIAVDTFILSMVMIYVYEKRQNLWVTISIHALKNAVAFLALFVFKIV